MIRARGRTDDAFRILENYSFSHLLAFYHYCLGKYEICFIASLVYIMGSISQVVPTPDSRTRPINDRRVLEVIPDKASLKKKKYLEERLK